MRAASQTQVLVAALGCLACKTPMPMQHRMLSNKKQHVVSWHLTRELSRTAARNGGVVHVTMQPSREAVSA